MTQRLTSKRYAKNLRAGDRVLLGANVHTVIAVDVTRRSPDGSPAAVLVRHSGGAHETTARDRVEVFNPNPF